MIKCLQKQMGKAERTYEVIRIRSSGFLEKMK